MKCKHCINSERHQCGSKIIWYCGVIKSNRTNIGKKKIKANDEQCWYFVEEYQETYNSAMKSKLNKKEIGTEEKSNDNNL